LASFCLFCSSSRVRQFSCQLAVLFPLIVDQFARPLTLPHQPEIKVANAHVALRNLFKKTGFQVFARLPRHLVRPLRIGAG
jgi:hypothetical protein